MDTLPDGHSVLLASSHVGLDLLVEVIDHLASDFGVHIRDLQDLSVRHLHDSVCEIFKALVMGNHNHCDFVLDVEINQDFHDDVC